MQLPPSLAQAMTPFPYAIAGTASLDAAKEMMKEHKVRHLPVTDGRSVVGVLSERDLSAALFLAPSADGKPLKVADVAVPDAYSVDLSEPLEMVLLTMAERHIGSAVVTRKGQLAGIFTSVDACRCFGEYIRENFPTPDGDAAA